MLRTRFLAPAAALTEGWERANGFLSELVGAALRGGQGAGFADTPPNHEACRAAAELLAQGERESAKDLIRALARAREAGHLAPELVPQLARLVQHFRAWTADAPFLERYRSGLTRLDAEPAGGEPPGSAATTLSGLSVVSEVCGRLWGLWPDAPAMVLQLAPRLEEGWPGMSLLGLRIGTTTADVRFQRATSGYILQASRAHGGRLRVTVMLPHLAPTGIWLDDELLGGQRAVFDLAGEHELRIAAG